MIKGGCLVNSSMKKYLIRELEKLAEKQSSPIHAMNLEETKQDLGKMPICSKSKGIDGKIEGESPKRKKGKRDPTPMSIFMKECYNRPDHKVMMKGGMSNPQFQEVGKICRAEWKTKK